MIARTIRPQRPIQVLSADLANKIAAGEVVERPASVVKELVENAIDAGATRIEVEVRDGGKEYIRVTDDGCGIDRDHLPSAFLRHATSKISSIEDLSTVLSLGFRGEALPSIASCSEIEMISCPAGSEAARISIKGGMVEPVTTAAGAPGTSVIVRRLFYNTPARYKFMKQGATEKRYIAEYVTNMALAYPDIAFRFVGDQSVMLTTPGNSDLLAALGAIHGSAHARRMIPVQWDSPFVMVSGYISPPDDTRSNRTHETLFVNGRWVQNRLLYAAVEKGYDTMLGSRRYPVVALHLSIDPTLLDVNVHPAKTEVRFRNESETFKNILLAVRGALTASNLAPQIIDRKRESEPLDTQVVSYRREPPMRPSAEPHTYKPNDSHVHVDTVLKPNSSSGVTPNLGLFVAEKQPETGSLDTLPAVLDGDSTSPDLQAHLHMPLAQTEIPSEAEAVREYLRQAPILGQVLNTYLAVAVPFGLWLIDQHVAHERVLYEQVLARRSSEASQLLLVPVTMQLSATDAALIESVLNELATIGFDLEPFGSSTYLVRAIPLNLGSSPDAEALRELILEVAATWEHSGPTRRERVSAMIACKAAIKAGYHLEPAAQKALLQSLSHVENPFACPHGRPVMIALGREELERRFGRR